MPWVLWGVLSIRTGAAKVHDWLPESRPQRADYEQFLRWFGDDQFIVLSWKNASYDDSRMDDVRRALIDKNETQKDAPFRSIDTGSSLLEELISPPLSLSKPAALETLQGFLIGPEGQGCILIKLTEAGIEHGEDTIELAVDTVRDTANIDQDDIVVVGTLFEEVTVDQASHRSLRYLVPPSTLAAITVAIIALGKWRASLLVFVIAGIGQLIATALVYYSGGEFSAVLIVLPTLVFMLVLSSTVHLVNYHRDIGAGSHHGYKALAMGFKPTVLATLTTILGMGSLAVSDLEPVRLFGIYSCIALGIATTVALLIFPALADLLLTTGKQNLKNKNAQNLNSRTFERGSYWVTKLRYPILMVSSLLLLTTLYGACNVQALAKFDRMFAKSSKPVEGMEWFETNIGPITSFEVLIHFTDDHNLLQQIRWLAEIEKSLDQTEYVGFTLAPTDVLPPVPSNRGVRATAIRAAYEAKLGGLLDELQSRGMVAMQDGKLIWRITCKLSALGNSFGHYIDTLDAAAKSTIHQNPSQDSAPSKITITGLSPIAHEAQIVLISDLGNSFLTAFILITPVMMLVSRSFFIGLLLMVPNVLPVALVFGTLGLIRSPIDIASILTASIALGIAVDDTLHFVNWFLEGIDNGLGTDGSIAFAYRHCVAAMLETTLISCSAMIPFLFSDFVPTQRFSMLMIAMLTLALLGDLLLLPALLSVLYGRNRRTRFRSHATTDSPDNASF